MTEILSEVYQGPARGNRTKGKSQQADFPQPPLLAMHTSFLGRFLSGLICFPSCFFFFGPMLVEVGQAHR